MKSRIAHKLKDNLIKKLGNTYCRIKPSKNKGVGVFTVKNIPKGINPFPYSMSVRWIRLSDSDIKNLPKPIQKMISDFYVYSQGHYYVSYDGLDSNDISFFVNNSKKPNLKSEDGSDFITIRKIKKGDELTVDYSTYDRVK